MTPMMTRTSDRGRHKQIFLIQEDAGVLLVGYCVQALIDGTTPHRKKKERLAVGIRFLGKKLVH